MLKLTSKRQNYGIIFLYCISVNIFIDVYKIFLLLDYIFQERRDYISLGHVPSNNQENLTSFLLFHNQVSFNCHKYYITIKSTNFSRLFSSSDTCWVSVFLPLSENVPFYLLILWNFVMQTKKEEAQEEEVSDLGQGRGVLRTSEDTL